MTDDEAEKIKHIAHTIGDLFTLNNYSAKEGMLGLCTALASASHVLDIPEEVVFDYLRRVRKDLNENPRVKIMEKA